VVIFVQQNMIGRESLNSWLCQHKPAFCFYRKKGICRVWLGCFREIIFFAFLLFDLQKVTKRGWVSNSRGAWQIRGSSDGEVDPDPCLSTLSRNSKK